MSKQWFDHQHRPPGFNLPCLCCWQRLQQTPTTSIQLNFQILIFDFFSSTLRGSCFSVTQQSAPPTQPALVKLATIDIAEEGVGMCAFKKDCILPIMTSTNPPGLRDNLCFVWAYSLRIRQHYRRGICWCFVQFDNSCSFRLSKIDYWWNLSKYNKTMTIGSLTSLIGIFAYIYVSL